MVNTLYFQEKRNLLDLPQLSGKVRSKPGKRCRMEHSSTVESGCGFNFPVAQNSIVFVNVYLTKEPHLKSIL